MSNPSKRKGTAFEVGVVEFLKQHGFPNAERLAQAGKNDRGDITGVPLWTLELKATKTFDLAGAMDEAQREARSGVFHSRYAVIQKRPRHSIAEAYVVLPLSVFVDVIR